MRKEALRLVAANYQRTHRALLDAKWMLLDSQGQPLSAELTQMMIHMQIAPTLPLRVGQLAEYGMGLQIGTRALSETVDQHFELSLIALELHWLGAAYFLIDFRHRFHPMRPREHRVQCDPTDKAPGKHAALR